VRRRVGDVEQRVRDLVLADEPLDELVVEERDRLRAVRDREASARRGAITIRS
jgi:hypothetical protein